MTSLISFARHLVLQSPMDAQSNGGGTVGDDGFDEAERWLDAARSGDRQAFHHLVEHSRARVYGVIVNMVRNEADALDLTQETFVKVWRGLPGFEGRSRYSTWLYRIAHNVTYDFLRARKSRGGPGGGDELDESLLRPDRMEASAPTAPRASDSPDELADRGDLRALIASLMQQLSDDHRQALLLREVQGLKYEEIAGVMDCTTGTVMSRLFYARKKMRQLLEPYRDLLADSGLSMPTGTPEK
ncbi:RNA polymerase sigma factor [Sulfuriroseicoccus oceanibius]|uniref:RNA polymerase sigma factor n=1 Tax=Sulfuriroseicoccus oceanibius TaxID=2707525 RepID=A0A6B3L8U3_9BACT|nr:sigma-70 family RNA polymerase sigma factor [Sulfuriroseicoccus oceanibius]QQL43888.1 sigma-70 family RNA polymerase sigma factor [Sulfuriroseicoccus oceanibius]